MLDREPARKKAKLPLSSTSTKSRPASGTSKTRLTGATTKLGVHNTTAREKNSMSTSGTLDGMPSASFKSQIASSRNQRRQTIDSRIQSPVAHSSEFKSIKAMRDKKNTQIKASSIETAPVLKAPSKTISLNKQPIKIQVTEEEKEKLLALGYSQEEIDHMINLGVTPLVLNRLIQKNLELTVQESIACLQNCIQMGQKDALKAKGSDLLLVLGNTGSGKSTTVNYLHGCTMEQKRERGKKTVFVKGESDIKEIARIGHGKQSKTFIPNVMRSEHTGLTFCDCPGFLDTRGAEISISNAVNRGHIIKNAQSVKILVLLECKIGDKGETIQPLKNILGNLCSNQEISQYANSILIGISKVPLMIDDYEPTLDDIIDDLFDGESLPEVLKKQTFIIDPFDARPENEKSSRENWLKKIEQLKPVENHKEIFQTVLTDSDKLKLVEISKEITKSIHKHFSTASFERVLSDINDLSYLNILKHPEVTTLVSNVMDEIQNHANQLKQAIETLTIKHEFEAARQALDSYINYYQLFSEYVPSLQKDIQEVQQFLHTKQLEFYVNDCEAALQKLTNVFDQTQNSNNKLHYSRALHSILNGKHSIHTNKDIKDILNFIEKIAQIKDFNNEAKELKNTLSALSDYAQSVENKLALETEYLEKNVEPLDEPLVTEEEKNEDFEDDFEADCAELTQPGSKLVDEYLYMNEQETEIFNKSGKFNDPFNKIKDKVYQQLIRIAGECLREIVNQAQLTLLKVKAEVSEALEQLNKLVNWDNQGKLLLGMLLKEMPQAIIQDDSKPSLFVDEASRETISSIIKLMYNLPKLQPIASILEAGCSSYQTIHVDLPNVSNEVNILSYIEKSLDNIYSYLLNEYKKEQIKLQREKEKQAVDTLINFIVKAVNTDPGLLESYSTKIAKCSKYQLELLASDKSVSQAFKAKFYEILGELQEKITWESCGSYFLRHMQASKLSSIKIAINTTGEINSINDLLTNMQHFLNHIDKFSALGEVNATIFRQQFEAFKLKTQAKFLKEQEAEEKRIAEEQRQKRIETLVQEINNDLLPNNKIQELRQSLKELDMLGSSNLKMIPLAARIKEQIKLFQSELHSKHYEAARNRLELLIEAKKVLNSYLAKCNASYEIFILNKEIIQYIGKLTKDTTTEIDNKISRDYILSRNFALGNIENIGNFYSVTSHFKNVAGADTLSNEVSKKILESIANLLRSYVNGFVAKRSVNLESFVNLLLLASFISQEIGSKDYLVSTSINELISNTIKTINETAPDTISYVGSQLSLKADDDTLSRYANKLISDHPAFKKALIQLYKSKISKRKAAHILSDISVENKEKLKSVYKVFAAQYDEILEEVITSAGSENFIALRNKIVADAQNYAKKMKGTINFQSKPDMVAKLLAEIFGLWSYLDAAQDGPNGNFKLNRASIFEPHTSQVLSVLLLLGMDTNSTLKNHLLQVKTGEGKSIIVVVAAVFFALLDFKVDVVCYNPYLASRDEKYGQPLFKALNVYRDVNYFDFGHLSGKHIKQLSLTSLVYHLMKNIHTDVQKKQEYKSILIIDEVDVFFSEKFMGQVYTPLVGLDSDNYKNLLLRIWSEREKYVQLTQSDFCEAVRNTKEFMRFLEEYPNATVFANYFLKEIRNGLVQVNAERHEYYCERGQIGYLNEVTNQIEFNIKSGQATCFAVAKEYQAGNIKQDMLANELRPYVYGGHYSYSELPRSYNYVLGVTGTLFSLSNFENSLLSKYSIERKTGIPTIFEKKCLDEESKLTVCAGNIDAQNEQAYFSNSKTHEQGYFNKIKSQIEEYIKKDRAVLLVFETEKRLHEYNKFISKSPYSLKSIETNKLIAETKHNERTQIILEAARRGRVTAMVRDFGRGSDFVCHDSQLRKCGGVAVICTFFPKHYAEEVQIKGRTWRQDDPGSFEFILFFDDLKDTFKLSTLSELDEANSKYKYLVSKREMFQEQIAKEMAKNIKKAEDNHDKTIQLTELLSKRGMFANVSKNKEKALEIVQEFTLSR